jgi:hypothetical protein
MLIVVVTIVTFMVCGCQTRLFPEAGARLLEASDVNRSLNAMRKYRKLRQNVLCDSPSGRGIQWTASSVAVAPRISGRRMHSSRNGWRSSDQLCPCQVRQLGTVHGAYDLLEEEVQYELHRVVAAEATALLPTRRRYDVPAFAGFLNHRLDDFGIGFQIAGHQEREAELRSKIQKGPLKATGWYWLRSRLAT